jgi:glycine/D-amino acid oxidase-like deaminating enzyme
MDAGAYLDLHHFTGGAFFLDRSPPDAWPARRIAARAAVAALAAEARSHGAEIRTGCDVKALLVRSGRVRGVLTDGGEIAADAVVLAAGLDAWRLLGLHGTSPAGEIDTDEIVVVRAPGTADGPVLGGAGWAAPDEAGLLHVSRPESSATLVSGLSEMAVVGRTEFSAASGASGPVEGLDGLYLAFAPDAWGVARAPAVATDLAGWIVDG